MRILQALVLALVLFAGSGGFACAQRLILSVSQPEVLITSNFAGADLVLFGVVEGVPDADHRYDYAVTVRGPQESFITWRKSRVAGIYINTDSRTFVDAPAVLAVATNRPAVQIAPAEVLRREQVGLSRNIFVQRVGPDFADVVADDPFRLAFLRIKQADGLYSEEPNGVLLLSPQVFRTSFRIPASAPVGTYEVEVKLFGQGQLLASAKTSVVVRKSGFGQQIAALAEDHGFLYGLCVACGALAIGFGANFVFRKD
ncbi:TIGR02186 family protein [Aquabacter sp. L1I39]|uniref:TIGR02186 family protein n=1 Tax=Aquabacter sp. L1I39 TaxID=2820278 RepID=UPI001ADB800B|nr:TIGR02186 family protein [Aquabacter sp. L1I39]QTL02357.1 TIGR02186 family protein [Aquabacter sp. L1I39]